LIIKELLEENLLNNKVLQLRIMNMINKYKIQLYFLEQLTELRKIKQVEKGSSMPRGKGTNTPMEFFASQSKRFL